MKITCGCDPELAIISGSRFVPCVDVVPGTKQEPFAVEGSKVGLKIQEDGVALEFNIAPVEPKKFRNAMATAMKELQPVVGKYFGVGHSYYVTDGATFEAAQLQHPKANTFGCDPDYLAYERGARRLPPDPKKFGMSRFFGGHIHIGYEKKEPGEDGFIPEWALIKGLDLTYMFDVMDGADPQPLRRQFYGLAGLYRSKPYGVEYRTPSAYWMNNLVRAERIILAAQTIVSRPNEFRRFHQEVDWATIQQAVNTSRIAGNQYDNISQQWHDFCELPEEV